MGTSWPVKTGTSNIIVCLSLAVNYMSSLTLGVVPCMTVLKFFCPCSVRQRSGTVTIALIVFSVANFILIYADILQSFDSVRDLNIRSKFTTSVCRMKEQYDCFEGLQPVRGGILITWGYLTLVRVTTKTFLQQCCYHFILIETGQ